MDISNKLIIFQSYREKTAEFRCSVGKGPVWKESMIMTQGRREVEVGTLLLGNDKNNVIADKVLSCF